MSLHVQLFPVFDDNYLFLIWDDNTREAVTIDPALSEPILKELKMKNLKLVAILNTHHHDDHVGGNLELKRQTGANIFFPDGDVLRFPGGDRPVRNGDKICILGASFQVIATPGHTRSHICYFVESHSWLFAGDTIFGMGCGRLFEGTPELMFESLNRLKSLPSRTKIFCAHEYTEKNLLFARSQGSDGPELDLYESVVRERRLKGMPTVPLDCERELKVNPFLRAKTVKEFAELREKRNHF